ncbi:hypothetical protein N658DRAFT_481619 [Parathielavia hyrcaniae]|uniref:Alkaline phosphatase n=1 Tax=Parathielavia hyrcaniae TaxID=113614 RepID=A0AAN6PQ06_9PEZI|nr:hypothetical protein N658DRAFT_481619 [Parathielavia hyrcaniae]
MLTTTLVSAAALCVVLQVTLFFRRQWRARRIREWVQAQRRIASFQYADSPEIDERLRLRAVENRRLKAAFGIDNSLTTSSPSTHKRFLQTSNGLLSGKGRSWEQLYRRAETFLKQETQDRARLPLAQTVRCMVLAVVLSDSFGVDPASIPRRDLVTVTEEINKQWMLSKCDPDGLAPSALLNATIASISRHMAPQVVARHGEGAPEEVLGLLMPQYETLWRVVLLTFATAYHHQPAAHPDAVQRTADVPACLGDPAREKEALKLAKEGLRLYPSNKHLYRAHAPSHASNLSSNPNPKPKSAPPLAADISTLHRHPSIWGPDALAFRPARFDGTSLTELQREAYVPFSVRPHRCPAGAGNGFGELMVLVLVCALGRGWWVADGEGSDGGVGLETDGDSEGFPGIEVREVRFEVRYEDLTLGRQVKVPMNGNAGEGCRGSSGHAGNPATKIGQLPTRTTPTWCSPRTFFRAHQLHQDGMAAIVRDDVSAPLATVRKTSSAMLCRLTLGALAAASVAKASFDRNLAYSSPSRRHPSLAVPLTHVSKRQTGDMFTPAEVNFTHGVASGDPYDDSVILWTRLSPTADSVASDMVPEGVVPIYDDAEGAPPSSKAACLEFKIGTDEALTNVVDQGRAYTTSDVDYTAKFEAGGLQPFTTYYYQFNVCDSDKASPLGRTKTIPAKTQKVDKNIRLAVYSCSNYPAGYFNAYGNPARKDSVDYVLHLGDYMYEYEPDSSLPDRNPSPNRETYSLYDYRARLGSYRTDADLQLSHGRFAWIPVWDDHEVANNAWRNGSSNSSGDDFRRRKQAAVRAYFEWMPLRQADLDDSLRIWRGFAFGTLFDLAMLDTRNYDRDLTVLNGLAGIGGNSAEVEKQVGWQNRTIMGFAQEAWLYGQLRESSARGAAWRVIGNQVIFSRMTLGILPGQLDKPFNRDQWDGYLANRDRVYRCLDEGRINNTVMLSGDSHASWVSDLAWLGERDYDEDTGRGAFGVELAGTAVTSSSPVGSTPKFAANLLSQWLVGQNPELQWQDLFYRGYFEMSIGYDAMHATFYGIPDVKKRSADEVVVARFQINNGENRLARNPTVGGGRAKSGALKNGRVDLF